MESWFIVSLIGKDRPGIVAQLSAALCQNGANLGASSMARLGDYFSIMMMVEFSGDEKALKEMIEPVGKQLELRFQVDAVEGDYEHQVQPDVRISIYADDRKGIVEDVTTLLADAGLNILHLDSNLDQGEKPTYYLHIEGTVARGIDPLYDALEILSNDKNMTAQLIPISSMT